MLLEELKHIKQNQDWPHEGAVHIQRTQPHFQYMEDLKSAADAACTVRKGIVETAARGGGNLAAMERMAKAADAAVISSGHSHLFLGVKEVQWLLRESDVVVKQTVTKVLEEVKAISAASGVAAVRWGFLWPGE